MRNIVEYTCMKLQGLSTATFTAATTDIITSNSHGLVNGDRIMVSSATTLPAGLSASTVYWVIEAATNTFKLSATPVAPYTTGLIAPPVAVDITSAGTGTHTWIEHDIGKNINCRDFRHAIFAVATGSSANLTLKFVGALSDDYTTLNDLACPDFSASQSNANMWDYIEVVDLQSGTAINGDTGISPAGTDDYRLFEMNINGLDWINCILTAWSAGDVSIVVKLYND